MNRPLDDIRISASLVVFKPDFVLLGRTLRALEIAGMVSTGLRSE